MLEILTERCCLRPMKDADFPALCRYLQDPEVMYAYGHAFSDREVWDWLRRQQARYAVPGYGALALELRATGEMIGQCGITLQTCEGVTSCTCAASGHSAARQTGDGQEDGAAAASGEQPLAGDMAGQMAGAATSPGELPSEDASPADASSGETSPQDPSSGEPSCRVLLSGKLPSSKLSSGEDADGEGASRPLSRAIGATPRCVRVPEVGYLLARRYWHQGYATEAARACTEFAFDVLGLPEVFACIRENNHPSRAVARRNGMEVCGRFLRHYAGQDMEHVLYVASREDWRPVCGPTAAAGLQR